MVIADGSYTEHGREIFDDDVSKDDTKGKHPKKGVSVCVCMEGGGWILFP